MLNNGKVYENGGNNMSGNQKNNEVSVCIATSNGLFTGVFEKTAKIIEVINIIISEKGLDASDEFNLVHNGQILEPVQRTLVSFGLEGTVKLDLVAVGSGV